MFTIKLFSSAEDILNSKFERWLFLYSSIRLLSIAFSRWILYFCYDFVFVKEIKVSAYKSKKKSNLTYIYEEQVQIKNVMETIHYCQNFENHGGTIYVAKIYFTMTLKKLLQNVQFYKKSYVIISSRSNMIIINEAKLVENAYLALKKFLLVVYYILLDILTASTEHYALKNSC